MKKEIKALATTIILSTVFATATLAGNWETDSNGWWYRNSDGSYPKSTWAWIDTDNDGTAECYYFDSDGYLVMNSLTPDGYRVDASGAWVYNDTIMTKSTGADGPTSSLVIEGGSYYPTTGTVSSGDTAVEEVIITGELVQDSVGYYYSYSDGSYASNAWVEIDGQYSYFGADGYRVTGWFTDNGTVYYANEQGIWMENAYQDVAAIIQSGDLRRAYNFACFKWVKGTTDANLGTHYFAVVGYTNRQGNCYVMAGTFAEMARAMGYDAVQMSGLVPLRRGGLGPHS